MGEHIKAAVLTFRKKRNKTQEEVAQAIGVTRQTIIAIEKGNYTPSVLLAIKLAKFFNTSVEELFHYEK
jgi:putative transcriptional regulator